MSKEAEFSYNQAVADEIYPDVFGGESLAIQEMFSEIRELGYNYNYFADIKLRRVKNTRTMDILLKYYPQMESIYSKAELLIKINPDIYHAIRDLAMKEYSALSSLNKMDISSFQKVLSRGKLSKVNY